MCWPGPIPPVQIWSAIWRVNDPVDRGYWIQSLHHDWIIQLRLMSYCLDRYERVARLRGGGLKLCNCCQSDGHRRPLNRCGGWSFVTPWLPLLTPVIDRWSRPSRSLLIADVIRCLIRLLDALECSNSSDHCCWSWLRFRSDCGALVSVIYCRRLFIDGWSRRAGDHLAADSASASAPVGDWKRRIELPSHKDQKWNIWNTES